MSKRKPNNPRHRVERSLRSLLKSNHVAVVCIETTDRQGLINWRSAKSIAPSQAIADAVCEIAHRWTILVGVMCQAPDGSQYLRCEEARPQGVYKSEHLSDVIAKVHDDFLAGANPNQVVNSGWLAVPDDVEITEEQAAKVFAAVGGWMNEDVKVAA